MKHDVDINSEIYCLTCYNQADEFVNRITVAMAENLSICTEDCLEETFSVFD